MKAEDLRAVQAPLKERYGGAPEAALITLRAQGRLGDGVTCRIETGKALVAAGLHPATGGNGLSVCSGDMLLEALVACAGVTMNAVATALGIEFRDASVEAEGTLDSDASQEQLSTLMRLTERYCVVYQTLAHAPAIVVSTQLADAGVQKRP
jgi:uncharacterized OsmC-like protein